TAAGGRSLAGHVVLCNPVQQAGRNSTPLAAIPAAYTSLCGHDQSRAIVWPTLLSPMAGHGRIALCTSCATDWEGAWSACRDGSGPGHYPQPCSARGLESPPTRVCRAIQECDMSLDD